MNPVIPTDAEIARWSAHDGQPLHLVSIGGPEEGDDVTPCPALVGAGFVHVAWDLNEIELAQLATGGRLWLTTWTLGEAEAEIYGQSGYKVVIVEPKR